MVELVFNGAMTGVVFYVISAVLKLAIVIRPFKLSLIDSLKQWELVLNLFINQKLKMLRLMNLLHQILARMLFVKQLNLKLIHLIMTLHIPLVLMKTLSDSLSLLPLPMGVLLPY